MLRNLCVVVILGALISGCAVRTEWYKAGATLEERKSDESDCRIRTQDLDVQGDILFPFAARTGFDDCMKAKGWEERSK